MICFLIQTTLTNLEVRLKPVWSSDILCFLDSRMTWSKAGHWREHNCLGADVHMGKTLLTKTFFPPVCVDWPTIEWLASPPCWLWWFSFKQNGYPLSRQSFGKKKNEQKAEKLSWQAGECSHERNIEATVVRLSALFSLAARLICTEEGGWIRATEMKRKEEKKLKARQIIGFGSAWTWVCAQQCGCVCTAGACAQGHLSREQGLALPGTATVQAGWRINASRLPFPVFPF